MISRNQHVLQHNDKLSVARLSPRRQRQRLEVSSRRLEVVSLSNPKDEEEEEEEVWQVGLQMPLKPL